MDTMIAILKRSFWKNFKKKFWHFLKGIFRLGAIWRAKNSSDEFLSMFRRSRFGSSIWCIFISVSPLVWTHSLARGLQYLWKLFCPVLILILVPPVQHAVDRVVSGDHDVSLASCLPGSTWHRHDHCFIARPPVFCNALDVFAINLRCARRHLWKLNLSALNTKLISP